MNFWLWILLGAIIALVLSSSYPCFIICKRVKQLRKDATKDVKELGKFDGEESRFTISNFTFHKAHKHIIATDGWR